MAANSDALDACGCGFEAKYPISDPLPTRHHPHSMSLPTHSDTTTAGREMGSADLTTNVGDKKDAVSSTTLSPLYPAKTQPLHRINGLLLDGQREAVLLKDELLFIEESTDPSDEGQSWRMAMAAAERG